jgi:HAD superfamily hydrolase (TIGR01509 family)
MTRLQGIIFDFNGTLLKDSNWHEDAWITIASKLRTKPLTVDEFQHNGHGRSNKEIITYLLGREPSAQELETVVDEKELMYRTVCLQKRNEFHLAPGVISFLDGAKELGIPSTIATGSYATNVDFYFNHFQLSHWFQRSNVVLDDGTYQGKPAPFIFQIAAKKLCLDPSECLVFEDSYSGIESAWKAGVGHIVAVEPLLKPELVNAPNELITFTNGFEAIEISDYFN